jgi:hypothetical protein
MMPPNARCVVRLLSFRGDVSSGFLINFGCAPGVPLGGTRFSRKNTPRPSRGSATDVTNSIEGYFSPTATLKRSRSMMM